MGTGVWEWMYSATNLVQEKAPDLTPMKEVWQKGYDVGREATIHVDDAVRSKSREFYHYFSDDHVRANLTHIATSFSKHGALYIARLYGGGPIIDVVARSLQDSKANSQKERIHELETRVAKLEKDLNNLMILEQVQTPGSSMTRSEPDFKANLIRRPEDVIHVFATKPFICKKLFDNLIVPGTGSNRKSPVDQQWNDQKN